MARKYANLKAEHEELLLKVYASPECDRRDEGDAFIPPDPSMEHLALSQTDSCAKF